MEGRIPEQESRTPKIERRKSRIEDLPHLKHLWKLCFGDEDSHIDFYFAHRNWTEENVVLLMDGTIVSMLSMIPVSIVKSTGERCAASMLYAIATHPDWQNRGLAGRLMKFAEESLLDRGVGATMLVPAEEELFQFYERKGYRAEYSLREMTLSKAELDHLAAQKLLPASSGNVAAASVNNKRKPQLEPLCLIPAEPSDYNKIRRRLLTGMTYVDYRVEEIAFQKQESRLYHADIYLIKSRKDALETDAEKALGCAVLERISEEKIIVKELLVPEQYVLRAAKSIADLMQAETFLIRTPVLSGNTLAGCVKPFGMLQMQADAGQDCGTDSYPYLGIAFD